MKHYKYILLTTIVVCIAIKGWSQERIVDSSFDTWWSNINKYNVNKSWFFSSELHIRRANGLDYWQQFLFRPALNYKINPNVDLTVGYTYIKSYPYGEQPIAIETPENNFWEQVTLKQTIGKLKISHRYRFEHRFIGKIVFDEVDLTPSINGNMFAQRFRYRLTLSKSISKNEKLFCKGFNEVWVNIDDKSLMPTSLNQNWAYVGIGYRFLPQANIQLGYMNRVIRKGDGIHYENNHTLQFTIGYEFFKPKKEN